MGATANLLLGDPERGRALFQSLNCIVCHSVNGTGGTAAPDLGRDRARGFSTYEMATLMWNHAPSMWGAMAKQGVPRPVVDEQQSADLFVFFFAASYFEEPGDSRRGKQVFLARRCAQCHGIESPARAGIRPVKEWESLWDPIALAREMWAHSGEMVNALNQSKVPYPRLSAQELADLLTWLRKSRREPPHPGFAPASPESGRALLESKGCTGCHHGEMTLESHTTRYGLTDFAAALWNHPARIENRRAPLSVEEMRRLVGYLIASQFFDERGDPGRGKRVFERKRCNVCHDDPSSGAPARAAMAGRMTSQELVAALWKHGPQMLERMQSRKLAWPHFSDSEMADLSAYLNGAQFKWRAVP